MFVCHTPRSMLFPKAHITLMRSNKIEYYLQHLMKSTQKIKDHSCQILVALERLGKGCGFERNKLVQPQNDQTAIKLARELFNCVREEVMSLDKRLLVIVMSEIQLELHNDYFDSIK